MGTGEKKRKKRRNRTKGKTEIKKRGKEKKD